MRPIIIVMAIIFSLNAQGPDAQTRFLGPQQVNALPSVPPDQRIPYGPDAEQFGELRLPRVMSGRVPVAVVLHGGCWKARHGDLVADVQNTAPLATALTELGIATWNLEYRRIDQPGGGWPGTFEDVARGVDHIRALAASYPLDLNAGRDRRAFSGRAPRHLGRGPRATSEAQPILLGGSAPHPRHRQPRWACRSRDPMADGTAGLRGAGSDALAWWFAR